MYTFRTSHVQTVRMINTIDKPFSLVYVASVACMTVYRNLTVCNMLITCGALKMVSNVCREVNKVREERLRRTECDRLRRERN